MYVDNIKFTHTRPTTVGGLENFYDMVDSSDFRAMFDYSVDVGIRVQCFVDVLACFAAEAFPLRSLRVSNSNTLKLSWFTPELRQLRTYLCDINQEYHDTGSSHIKSLRDNYRRQYKSALIQAKRAANDKFIQDHKRSSRSIWKVITKNKNQLTTDCRSTLTADDFNQYFLRLPNKLSSGVPPAGDPFSIARFVPTLGTYFGFCTLSQMEVSSAVDAIKMSRSFDYFGLNAMMIKHVKSLIVAPLTELFNTCIRTGNFIDVFKIANVTPIHKKGEINDPSNYRPISILPVFSKVF